MSSRQSSHPVSYNQDLANCQGDKTNILRAYGTKSNIATDWLGIALIQANETHIDMKAT